MTCRPDKYRPSPGQTAFRWLYSVLLGIAAPVVFISQTFKGYQQDSAAGHRLFERFGLVPPPTRKGGYLFHCVSVGEVVAASVVVKRILHDEPEAQVTVTTTTITGSARVKDIFGNAVHHFYLPYDLSLTMDAMLRRIKPKQIVITEVELWPNLIHRCWRRHIPVLVMNARMTDRSARRYKKLSLLFAPMLKKISHVCAQGQRDYDNYRLLGLDDSKLTLTNNIKFDQAVFDGVRSQTFHGIDRQHYRALIGGSTHDVEETALIYAFQQLKPEFPNLILILVPRHPERFAVVKKLLADARLNTVYSSEGGQVNHTSDVLLVDEMGKLNAAYQCAAVAFVGGSLADRGGHNALEPAANKLPVIMGPHTYNNPVICQYLQDSGAMVIVHDEKALTCQCRAWLAHPASASGAGMAGYQVLKANQGAVAKTMAVVRGFADQN